MSNARKRFAKLAMTAAALAAGILPGSCALQLRDAAVDGLSSFTSNTVAEVLNSAVDVDNLLGAGG